MNRNLPVRTYQRKNVAKPTLDLHQPLKFNNVTASKASNGERSLNESLDNDPFDTTFDRIAKNARLPFPPIEASENVSCLSTSYDTSKNQSSSPLRVSINLSDINLRPIRKRRGERKKEPEVQVVKGVFNKKLRSKSQNNKSSSSKSKNVLHKSYSKAKQKSTKRNYKRKTARRGKGKAATNPKTISSLLSSNESTNSHSDKCGSDLIESRKNDLTEKGESSKHSTEKSVEILSLTRSFSSLKNKPCSVALSRSSVQSLRISKNYTQSIELDSITEDKILSPVAVSEKVTLRKTKTSQNSNSRQSCAFAIRQCSVQLDKLRIANEAGGHTTNSAEYDSAFNTKHCSIIINRLGTARTVEALNDRAAERTDTTCVKSCFIKIDRLKSLVTEKSPSNEKKVQKMISSTPVGRTIRPSMYPMSFSPIPINYTDKPGISNTRTGNTSVSICKEEQSPSSSRNLDDDPSCDVSENVPRNKTELPTCSATEFSEVSIIQQKEEISVSEEMSKLSDSSHWLTIDKSTESSSSNSSGSKSESLDTSDRHTETTDNFTKVSDLEKSEVDFQEEDTKNFKLWNISADNDRSQSLFGNTVADNSNLTDSTRPTSFANSTTAMQSTHKTEPDDELYETSAACLTTSHHNTALELNSIKIDEDEEVSTEGAISRDVETTDCKRRTRSNGKDVFEKSGKERSSVEAYVLLTRLQDPFRVTNLRKRYRKWDVELTNIREDSNVANSFIKDETSLKDSVECEEERTRAKKIKFSDWHLGSDRTSQVAKSVYLKPGKSWTRSLSILNNIQNEFNLDELSIGKGKKWRHSVKDILNMQKQGLIQSCIWGNENDEESRLYAETNDKSQCTLNNNSLGRLSRRVSIRVVPTNKTVKCIEDASFLEAYGIVPFERKKSTLTRKKRTALLRSRSDKLNDDICKAPITATARQVVLQRCVQDEYMPISEYFPDLYLENCRKIGEGVYGEVFLYENKSQMSVIKIIPIEGNELVNGEPQKKFHEILSEIVIAKELHNLRFHKTHNTNGFVAVKNIKCIMGKYPARLVELWSLYDEEKNSENDSPSMFKEDQLYIVLELGHGGQDLEAFVFQTAEEAYALFVQAAFALAVAEKAVEFEHRDLHWGNVLISRTIDPDVCYKLDGKEFKLLTKGVQVSIIDFTLSRMSYQGCCIFNDLASDPALFTAQGEYQFEIYRMMRDRTENDWQRFEPYTNVLWLHYTLDKMITAVRYKRRTLKIHKNAILSLEVLKREILSYNSAFDFVTNCDKLTSVLCTD